MTASSTIYGGAGFTRPAPRADSDAYFGGMSWFGQGYDATRHKGNRAQVAPTTLSEDLQLRDLARRQLISTNRDLARNFPIAAWMIRKHADYVSTFHFRAKTANAAFNAELNRFMDWWSRPENCDSTGRDALPDLCRLWEVLRTIDGDCLINQTRAGTLQTIEGDRLQTQGGIPFADLGIDDPAWVINGVWVNPYYRHRGYMVFRRPPQWVGLQFDRMIPARFASLFGYFSFRKDQVRGISPLSSAANALRDIYESFDYALIKAKISQFFAMQIIRKSADEFAPMEARQDETYPNADPTKPRYDINLSRGPVLTEMDPGDEMKVVESQTPSNQFRVFTTAMIMTALKALDLPFGFYDESHTNYSGLRLGGVQYEQSAQAKRQSARRNLDKQTAWRIGLAIADGDLTLPRGMQISDVRWEWSHAGIPLFDPLKEISADIAAVNAGFASPQEVCRARGKDFEAVIDEIAAARSYAAGRGVVLSTALASTAGDDPNKSATQTEDQNVQEDEGTKGQGGQAEQDRMAWQIIRGQHTSGLTEAVA